MKLTNADKQLLIQWGYEKKDFAQIEQATTKTIYETNGQHISANEALRILGRETYLSGISRSAFHFSSWRENKTGQGVHFDSSRLFKQT